METHILRSCLVFYMDDCTNILWYQKYNTELFNLFLKGTAYFEISGQSTDQEDSKSLQEPTTFILRAALARAPAQASDFTWTTLGSWKKHP